MKHAPFSRLFSRWLPISLSFSALASLALAIQVASPMITVNPGRSGYCDIVVATAPGAIAYYTVDGSVPSELSPQVPASGIVRVLKADISFKARAWQDGLEPSNVATVNPSGTQIQVQGFYSAGENHTLAVLPGGLVESWGSNGQNRLGNLVSPALGQTTQVVESTGKPFTGVVQVAASWQSAASNGFSAALVDPDGTGNNVQIFAWGANNAGQLGNSSQTSLSAAPVAVLSTASSSPGSWLHDVYMVDLGEEYGVALTTPGEIHAWGQNAAGQLATGTAGSYRNYTAPVQYNDGTTSGPLTGQWLIAAGGRHSLSVGLDNRIWAWGDNASRQLGQSTTVTAANVPVAKPVVGLPALAAGVYWSQVEAGDTTSAAVMSNGEIWVWGNSAGGRLGDGLTTATPTPRRVKANATTFFTGAKSVSMGLDHMLILKTDNTVWATGANGNGQLGNGTTTASAYPVQVKMDAATFLTNIVSVDAGGGYSTALTSDGVLYTWGSNSVGQTGGTTTANKTYAAIAANIPNLNTPTLFQGATFSTVTGVQEDNGSWSVIDSTKPNRAVTGDKIANAITFKIAETSGPTGIVKVEFYWGEQLVGSDTTLPFVYRWENLDYNTYGLKAVMTAANGNTSEQSLTHYLQEPITENGRLANAPNDASNPARDVFVISLDGLKSLKFPGPYTAAQWNAEFNGGLASQPKFYTAPTGNASTYNFADYLQPVTAFPLLGLAANVVVDNYIGYPIAAFGTQATGYPLYDDQFYRFVVHAGSVTWSASTKNVGGTAYHEGLFWNHVAWVRVCDADYKSSGVEASTGWVEIVIPRDPALVSAPSGTAALAEYNAEKPEAVKRWTSFLRYGTWPNPDYAEAQADHLYSEARMASQTDYTAQGSSYVIAHRYSPPLGAARRSFVVAASASVSIKATSTSTTMVNAHLLPTVPSGRYPLYALQFDSKSSGWQSQMLGQTWFGGAPLPPEYAGKSVEELLQIDGEINASSFPASSYPQNPYVEGLPAGDPEYTRVSLSSITAECPSLRRYQSLDSLVYKLTKGFKTADGKAIALINYVINEIGTVDPIGYNDNATGTVADISINPPGITRNAYGVYLQGQGNPIEQCSLLVYMLRQAGIPAVYAFPADNSLIMLDKRMSQALGFQVRGAVDRLGNLENSSTLLPVNYPWVTVYINGQWQHVFPWIKDVEIIEGPGLFEFMPPQFDTGRKIMDAFVMGAKYVQSPAGSNTWVANSSDPFGKFIIGKKDTPADLLPAFFTEQIHLKRPDVSLDQIGIRVRQRPHLYSSFREMPRPLKITANPTFVRDLISDPNLFDTVRYQVGTPGDTSPAIITAQFYAADVCNRRLSVSQQLKTLSDGAPYQMQVALVLAPSEYDDSTYEAATVNGSAFTNVTAGIGKRQVKTALIGVTSNLQIQSEYWRQRKYTGADSSSTQDSANVFLGYQSIKYSKIVSKIRGGDSAAICTNFGRVTQRAIDVLLDEQRKGKYDFDYLKLNIESTEENIQYWEDEIVYWKEDIAYWKQWKIDMAAETNANPDLTAAEKSSINASNNAFADSIIAEDNAYITYMQTEWLAPYEADLAAFKARAYSPYVYMDLLQNGGLSLLGASYYKLEDEFNDQLLRWNKLTAPTIFRSGTAVMRAKRYGTRPQFKNLTDGKESGDWTGVQLAQPYVDMMHNEVTLICGVRKDAGQDIVSVRDDFNPLWLLNSSASEHVAIERFFAQDGVDAVSTMKLLELSRRDGLRTANDVTSTLNSSSAVTLKFASVSTGTTGAGISISFTSDATAVTGVPVITTDTNAKTVAIKMGAKTGAVTSAQQIVDALSANALVRASVTAGTATALVGNRVINYSPLVTSAANLGIIRLTQQNAAIVTSDPRITFDTDDAALNTAVQAQLTTGSDDGYTIAYVTAQSVTGAKGYYKGAGALCNGPGAQVALLGSDLTPTNGGAGSNLSFESTMIWPPQITNITTTGATVGNWTFGNDAWGNVGMITTTTPTAFQTSIFAGQALNTNLSTSLMFGGLSTIGSSTFSVNTGLFGTMTQNAFTSFVNLSAPSGGLWTGSSASSLASVAFNSGALFFGSGNQTYFDLHSTVGDPVNIVTGAFYIDEVDLAMPGPFPLQIRRNYSSQSDAYGQFGWGWRTAFFPFLVPIEYNGHTRFHSAEPDGSNLTYDWVGTDTDGNEVWKPLPGKENGNPMLVNLRGDNMGSTANPFNNKIVKTVTTTTDWFGAITTHTFYTLYGGDGSTRVFEERSYPIYDDDYQVAVQRKRPYLTKWTDNRGNALTFTFGTDYRQPDYGEVVRIDSTNGASLSLVYDGYGHVAEVLSNDGRHLYYSYDDEGDLRSVTKPDGSVVRYDYKFDGVKNESTHLLIREVKPTGRIVRNIYDSTKRVTEQYVSMEGGRQPYPGQLSMSDSGQTLWRIAAFNYIGHTRTEASGATTYYDVYSGKTTASDARGKQVTYTYAKSLLTEIDDPEPGVVESRAWYSQADVTANVDGAYAYSVRSMTDKRGLSSTFKYDSSGNLKKVIQTGDVTGDGVSDTVAIDLEYNSNNLIKRRLISKNGNTSTANTANETRWLYENTSFQWLPTRVQTYSENAGSSTLIAETKQVYDSAYANPGANYQSAPYAKGLMVSSTRAFGTSDAATTEIAYTPQGYPSHISKATGTSDPTVEIWLRYNSRGELVEENDAADPAQSQKRTFYAYDGLGNPIWTERRDGEGNLMGWEYRYYNANGELEWSDGPKFAPEDYTYQTYTQTGKAKDSIVWRIEAASGDDVSNLTNRVVQPARSSDKYSVTTAIYDTADMLNSVLDPLGNETRYFYDDLGRVIRKEVWQGKAPTGASVPMASQPATWNANLLDFETYGYEPGGSVKEKRGRYVEDTTTYAYTADGKLKQQNNPDGTSLSRLYDTLGHMVKEETLPLGSVTTIQTDDVNRTVQTSTTSGAKTVTKLVTTDRRGNVISTTDTLGQTNSATYDDLDRVKTQTGASATSGSEQDVTTFVYDKSGFVTKSSNALGESTVVTKDAMGRTIKTELLDAAGGVVRRTSIDYFANHHGSMVTEGIGNQAVSTVTYVNERDKPVLVIDGNGKFSRQRYDASGNLASSEEPSQYVAATTGANPTPAGYLRFVSTFQYDALGRPTMQTNANSATTSFAYTWSSSGLQVDRIMPTGQSWNIIERINSDRLGRPMQSSLLGQGGATTRQNTTAYYTGAESAAATKWKGMVKSVSDGRGVTVVREYDDLARVKYLRATGPSPEHNVTNHYLYDDLGRMVRVDQDYTSYPTAGNRTRTRVYRSYDQRGAISTERVALVDNAGSETNHSAWTQTWNAAGRRTGLSNTLSPISGTGTAGGQYGFGYRVDDHMISARMDGQSFYFGYDARGLVARRTNAWRETKITARDVLGRILESSSYFNGTAPGANVNSFTETQTWTERSKLATYGFNVQGPVITALQLPGSPALTNSYAFTYMAGGQLFAEAQGDFAQDNVPTWLYGFDHDDITGGVTGTSYSLGISPTLGVRSSAVFKHTTSGSWNLKIGTGFVAGYGSSGFTPGFDAHRRAISQVLKNQAATSDLDQLANAAYDAEGFQLLREGYVLYPTGTSTPSPDPQPYQSMKWDAFGRLVECSTMEMHTIWGLTYWPETRRFSAVYDALGRRLRTVDATVDPTTAIVTAAPSIDSHYDPHVEFLELGITIGTTSRQWKVYGPDTDGTYGGLQGIGGLEAVRVEQSNEWTYVQSDLFGNTVAYKTGTSAAVWTNAEMNSYGLITNIAHSTLVLRSTNTNVAAISLWRGKRMDSTGLYWLGARYYDPLAGRFLSPDPKGHGVSPSLYDYANGDPVNNVDPDGRCFTLIRGGNNFESQGLSSITGTFAQQWAAQDYWDNPTAQTYNGGGAGSSGTGGNTQSWWQSFSDAAARTYEQDRVNYLNQGAGAELVLGVTLGALAEADKASGFTQSGVGLYMGPEIRFATVASAYLLEVSALRASMMLGVESSMAMKVIPTLTNVQYAVQSDEMISISAREGYISAVIDDSVMNVRYYTSNVSGGNYGTALLQEALAGAAYDIRVVEATLTGSNTIGAAGVGATPFAKSMQQLGFVIERVEGASVTFRKAP
jgi:RHS repeat-associated protein